MAFQPGTFQPQTFQPGTFQPHFWFMVEKFGAENFMAEKSVGERCRVEAWGWKVRGWDVLQPFVRGQDLPDIIVEKNLGEKLHEFMEKINTTMYKTGQPPCPINILTFLMIPFCCLSPVCWMTERNHNNRLDGVNKAKQKFNEDYGKD